MFSATAELIDGSWLIELTDGVSDHRFNPIPEELLAEFLDEGMFYVAVGALPESAYRAVLDALVDAGANVEGYI